MKTVKALGLLGLAVSACFAAQAFATTCPVVNGMQTQGSPVCIAPYGPVDGSGTGLVNVLAGPDDPQYYNSNSIFSSGGGINPYTQQSTPSSYWKSNGTGGSENTVMFTMSGSTSNTTFGIFDPSNISNTLALFQGGTANYRASLQYWLNGNFTATTWNNSGVQVGPTTGATFGDGNLFGYYLTVGGTTYYSDMTLNPDGVAHMASYAGAGQGTIKLTDGMFSVGEYILAWEDGLNGGDLDYNDFVVMVESVTPVPEPADLAVFGFGILLIGGFVALRRRRLDA